MRYVLRVTGKEKKPEPAKPGQFTVIKLTKTEQRGVSVWSAELQALMAKYPDVLMQYLRYDNRLCQYGFSFVSGNPPEVEELVAAGFLQWFPSKSYMTSRKGRIVIDYLGLFDGEQSQDLNGMITTYSQGAFR